jgi:uncharacterized membrane protein YphA (DoxX/SURF4 family)
MAAGSVVLAATFAWAGIMKVLRAERWRSDLRTYRLSRPLRGLGFLLLPWVELAIAIALIAGVARIGAAVALALIIAFCGAIVWARRLSGSDRLGCGCFGTANVRDYRILLLRNAVLGALAVSILASGRDRALGEAFPSEGPGVLLALLAASGLAAGAWILWQVNARIRQNQV